MLPTRSRTEVAAAVAWILVARTITSDGAPAAEFAAHGNGKPQVRNKIILPLLRPDLAVALLPGVCCEVKGGSLIGGLAYAALPRWCSTSAFRPAAVLRRRPSSCSYALSSFSRPASSSSCSSSSPLQLVTGHHGSPSSLFSTHCRQAPSRSYLVRDVHMEGS